MQMSDNRSTPGTPMFAHMNYTGLTIILTKARVEVGERATAGVLSSVRQTEGECHAAVRDEDVVFANPGNHGRRPEDVVRGRVGSAT